MKTLLKNAKLFPTLENNRDNITVKYDTNSNARNLRVEVYNGAENKSSQISIHDDLVFVYTHTGERLTINMRDGEVERDYVHKE
jgi:hypothetical protein